MLRYVAFSENGLWPRGCPSHTERLLRAPGWSRVADLSLLAAADLAGVSAAGAVAYLSWGRVILHQPASLYLKLTPLLAVFPASYAAAGLYPGFGLGAAETLRRLVHATNVAFVFLAAASVTHLN